MKESKYTRLSRIDVSEGVEAKGGLDYLSWAYAWHKLLEVYPDSTYEWGPGVAVEGGSVMVTTTVTVDGQPLTMQLPVMDHRNKAITNPNARDLNDAFMRCLVKNIAMHGLGISLYMGGKVKQVVETPLVDQAIALIEGGEFMDFHQFVKTLTEQDQVDVFNGWPGRQKDRVQETLAG